VIILFLVLFALAIGWIEYSSLDTALRSSARKRWPAHFGLFAISIAIQISLPISAVYSAMLAETHSYGLFNWIKVPFAFEAFLSVSVMSFTYYALHFAMHKVPLLWRLHRVHHSDYNLDISTTYRTHPLAVALTLGIAFLVVSVIGAAPQIVVFYISFVVVVDVLHHSSIQWPSFMERGMGKLLITPSQHHIHHSDFHRETDTNFSADFCFWDKLFGTFQADPLREKADFKYGLKEVSAKDAANLDAILLSPFFDKKRGP